MSYPLSFIPVLSVILILLSGGVRADTGHAHGQNKMPTGHHGTEHWNAPAEAVQRPNPVKADRASRARGKKLFQTHCVSCHGGTGKGDGPGAKALNPRPADLTVMAGQHPDGDFAWKIEHGRGPMPAWKGTLKQNQIWDLVNFVQGLGKNGGAAPGAPAHDPSHPH